MNASLDSLEKFIHDKALPDLIHCGLVHAQFETIHPFLNGNDRVGRLMITFLLCERNVLQRPLLYLSHYLKRNRSEYYERLTKIREAGDWEGWLRFFLKGVSEVSLEATETARKILILREKHRAIIRENISGTNGNALLDHLFEHPITTVNLVAEQLQLSFSSANSLVKQFEEHGLLFEVTGQARNRKYRYRPYLDLFPSAIPITPTDSTSTNEQTSATSTAPSTEESAP